MRDWRRSRRKKGRRREGKGRGREARIGDDVGGRGSGGLGPDHDDCDGGLGGSTDGGGGGGGPSPPQFDSEGVS